MTCALLALSQRLSPKGEPLRLMHRGSYFETRQLIDRMPQFTKAAFAETADVIIDEPISCDGCFHQFGPERLQSASPSALIFDTTLLGRDDGVSEYLATRDATGSEIVLR